MNNLLSNFDIQEELKQKLNNLPNNMNARDIADFLWVSKSTAYNIANSSDFPRLRTPGRRLVIIPKTTFIQWYFNNCVTASEIKN